MATTFTPNATHAVEACYTFNTACTLTLAGTCSAIVEFRSDTNATPTTVRMQTGSTMTLGIGVVVATTVGGPQQMCWLVPPGFNVRLVSTGTAAITTILNQTEVTL